MAEWTRAGTDFRIEMRGFAEMRKTFQEAPRRIQDIKRVWQLDVATAEAQEIQKLAKGRIKQAIQPVARNLITAVVVEPQNPAMWVNNGTGLFGPNKRRIFPKSASVLAFVWKGKQRFFASVAGQKGQHFIERGIQAFNPKANGWVKELNRRIVDVLKTR